MSLVGRAVAVLAAACLLAGACGGNDDHGGRRDVGAPTITATGTAAAEATPQRPAAEPIAEEPAVAEPVPTEAPAPDESAQPTPAVAPLEPTLVLAPVVSLADPIALVVRPGTGSGTGDLYVATRAGRVWLLGADGDEPPEMVLDISDLTTTDCETGLLGIAFDPDGSSLYVHHTDLRGDNQIVEYPMSGHRVLGHQGRTVLSVAQPACNHNGGHIAFGPEGNLWIGLGDGGGANDMFNHGQNLDSLLGTMVRIDPGASGGADYAIPADNPFAGGGGRPEIWVYGARNPWRFSFDGDIGDLWIADVGQTLGKRSTFLRPPTAGCPGPTRAGRSTEGTQRFSGSATPDDWSSPSTCTTTNWAAR